MSAHSKKRVRITEFASATWEAPTSGEEVSNPKENETTSATVPSLEELESLTVSDSSTCSTCVLRFKDFQEQRQHFSSDLHRYNARFRISRQLPPLSEEEFERLVEANALDTASQESLSGSETESDFEDENDGSKDQDRGNTGPLSSTGIALTSSVKLEFNHPTEPGKFIVVHKTALPDEKSLASLKDRGPWAVFMSGGGHFAGAVWNKDGVMTHHKTFHRYTSRKKQGGSQAVADSAGGRRIKSAGATLRRHGEQQLQAEVRALLVQWASALADVQCAYIRASVRERRDLLVGWDGSPLGGLLKTKRVRNIPIPTRRATLKEVQRVYEELMTAVVSTVSSVAERPKQPTEAEQTSSTTRDATNDEEVSARLRAAAAPPKEKGTAHLKKRDNTTLDAKPAPKTEQSEEDDESPVAEPLDPALEALLVACVTSDTAAISAYLSAADGTGTVDPKEVTFHAGYFANASNELSGATEELGLVGIASVLGNTTLITWLLDNDVSPCTGSSPYLATKSKAARTSLRKYWGAHPTKYEYELAGIPSPLSNEDVSGKRERERAKRKEKRKEKKVAAMSPEEKARQARAAAAEQRLLGGNRCAQCQKSLKGIVPFERLNFKYCSTTCVSKHREALAQDAERKKRAEAAQRR